MDNPVATEQDPNAQPTVSMNSRVPEIEGRFYFHELLKKSAFSSHFLVEDLQAPPNAPYSLMYYFLKQNTYESEAEFRYALAYYQKLQGYCAQPLAKSDIIKLHQVWSAEDAPNSAFELVLLFDLGEADRIDVDQIQVPQITKFLKSVCLLLQDLKRRSDLYHGNISIKNIVLAENELKISGFKPIFLNNQRFSNWKTELCARYSHYRLDLYMIGLIWLRLLGSRIEELTAGATDVDLLAGQVMAAYNALADDKKATIVQQLLDLQNSPNLNLEEVILLFDEYFVIETRRMMEGVASSQNSNTLLHQSLTDQDRQSIGNRPRDSFGGEPNIFSNGLNDSGIDNMTFKEPPSEQPHPGKADAEFTMPDNVTFHAGGVKGSVASGNMSEIQPFHKVDKRSSDIQSTDRELIAVVEQKGSVSERRVIGQTVKKESSLGALQQTESQSSLPVNESLANTGEIVPKESQNEQTNLITVESKETVPSVKAALSSKSNEAAISSKRSATGMSSASAKLKTDNRLKEGSERADVEGQIGVQHRASAAATVQKRQSSKSPGNSRKSVEKPVPKDLRQQRISTLVNVPNELNNDIVDLKATEELENNEKRPSNLRITSSKEQTRQSSGEANRQKLRSERLDGSKLAEEVELHPPKRSLRGGSQTKKQSPAEDSLPQQTELNDAIDKAADRLPSNQEARKSSAAGTAPRESKPRFRQSTKKTNGAKQPNGEQSQQKKLNLRQQLDLMNEKLRLQSRPLNYYDHDHYSSLNAKRAQPTVQLNPELTAEQKERISQRLKQEQSAKLELARQKSQERQALVEKKKQETDELNSTLKAKIEAILEKKLIDKRQQEKLARTAKLTEGPVETKMFGVTITTAPVEGVTNQSLGKRVARSPRKGKQPDDSPSKAGDLSPGEVADTLPLKSTAQSKLKQTYRSVKQTDPAAFTSYKDKNNIFVYNLELKNKNVTYKKLAWNPDQYIKAASRSPSPQPKSVQNTGQVSSDNKSRSQRFKKAQNPTVYGTPNEPEATKTFRSAKSNGGNLEDLLPVLKGEHLQVGEAQFDVQSYPKLNSFISDKLRLGRRAKTLEGEELANRVEAEVQKGDFEEALNLLSPAVVEGDADVVPALRAKILVGAAQRQDPESIKKGLIAVAEGLKSDLQAANDPSLVHDLALALAELELNHGTAKNALKLYQSSGIADSKELPAHHHEAYLKLLSQKGNEGELAAHYERLIDSSLAESFRHLDITQLFVNIAKAVELLAGSGDPARLARFHNRTAAALARIKGVHAALHTAEQDYENLLECFTLNSLRFAVRSNNFGFANFIIGEALKNKHIDLANMNEEEKRELATLVADVCWKFKELPDYGGFQETYLRYLTFAKNVVKQCDLNAENLRLSLLLNFNRGVYYLKEGSQKKAHEIFDKCLLTYHAFFKEADQDLYRVLFGLGEALWRRGKRSDAHYFFNRTLDEQCQDGQLKKEAKRRLAQLQFHAGDHEAAKQSARPFLDEHFETRHPRGFFRLLCLTYLACEKTASEDFQPYFKRLGELPPHSLSQELYWYFKMFRQFQRVYEEHHNYRENKRFVSLIEEIGKADGAGAALNAKRLLNVAALVFAEFVGGLGQGLKIGDSATSNQASAARSALVDAFYDQFLTVEENATVVARFALNLGLVFLHLVPLFNERVNNQQARQAVFEQVERTVPFETLELEARSLVSVSAAEARKKSAKLFEPAKPDAQPADQQRIPKMQSTVVLGGGPSDPDSWALANEFNGNAQLQGLVKGFLKQVKNMLFLDVVDNVLTYYLRFEASLVELGLNYPKYNFIKQLIRLHLSRAPNKLLDRPGFVAVLDALFDSHNISVADLKLLVILLEAFKDIDYLRLLALYLDQHHQTHARLLIKDLSFEQFLRKSGFVAEQLYGQLSQSKYYELENCYFMHQLESQHFVNIPKEFRFKVFLRARHDLLADPAMRSLVSAHVSPAELAFFDLRYHIYTAIVRRVKGGGEDNESAFKEFSERFRAALPRYVPESSKTTALLYDFVLLASLLDSSSGHQSSAALLEALNALLSAARSDLTYQFSRVYSMVGNAFFKYSHIEEAKAAKEKASELFAEDTKSSPAEPHYAPRVTRDQHQFQILSFLAMINLEQGDIKAAAQVGEKLEKWSVSDPAIQLNRLVVRALVNLNLNKGAEPLKNVYEAISQFGKMKLSDFLNRLYQAVLDKATLLVIEKSQSTEEVAAIRKRSKLSIGRLYDLPTV